MGRPVNSGTVIYKFVERRKQNAKWELGKEAVADSAPCRITLHFLVILEDENTYNDILASQCGARKLSLLGLRGMQGRYSYFSGAYRERGWLAGR